jgi:hypothetical protein
MLSHNIKEEYVGLIFFQFSSRYSTFKLQTATFSYGEVYLSAGVHIFYRIEII